MRDFVTEKEAEDRWCPYGRAVSIADKAHVVANRVAGEIPTCIGSNCMAWRWSHQDTGPTDAPTGFCGAFGLPKYF